MPKPTITVELRHRLTLQRKATAQIGGGPATRETWQDVRNIWGLVQSARGDADYQAMREASLVHFRIKVRSAADFSAGQRLLWDGRELEIEAVLPETPQPGFMQLVASQILGR